MQAFTARKWRFFCLKFAVMPLARDVKLLPVLCGREGEMLTKMVSQGGGMAEPCLRRDAVDTQSTRLEEISGPQQAFVEHPARWRRPRSVGKTT